MGRPADWSVVGYGSDPVPGDPARVEELARRYEKTADAIRTAVDGLTKITSNTDDQQSKAITELRKKAEEAGTDIGKAERRYREAGSALKDYAPELEEAQRISANAHASATEAANAPKPDGEDDKSSDEEDPAISDAKGRVATAIGIRDTAAEKAAGLIEDVIGTDGLEDGFWDNVGGFLKALGDIAGFIATVAGVLALVFCWVPVVGQALAAIALVATAVSLVCKIGVGSITGNWDVKGMAMDVIGIATLGIGRALGGAAKVSAMAARGRGLTAARGLSSRMHGVSRANLLGGRITNRAAAGLRSGSASHARNLGLADDLSLTAGSFGRGFTTVFRGPTGSPAAWKNIVTGADDTWARANFTSPRAAVNNLLGGGDDVTDAARLSPTLLENAPDVARLANQAQAYNTAAIAVNGPAFALSRYNEVSAALPSDSPIAEGGPPGPLDRVTTW